jgi:hypothetical protein
MGMAQDGSPSDRYHWKLGFGPRPESELYDLKKDPHQVNNVAADAAYAKIKNQLHADLMAELLANHDPRLNGDQFDYPPYTKVGLPK